MRKDIELNADGYAKKHRQKRMWYRIVSVMACVVVFCTTYALILPAITMDTSYDTYCGIEQHTHTDACYEVAGVPEHVEFTCEAAKQTDRQVIHTHNTFCFDESGELLCPLQEYSGEEHTHTSACYTDGTLTCGLAETLVHDHCAACRVTVAAVAPQNLICTKQEHTHTAECFEEKAKLSAEDTATTPVLADGGTEQNDDGVDLSKQIRVTEDGYQLKLDTFVTGETVKVTTFSPADIVLVLDDSGSMAYTIPSVATYSATYSVSTSGTYYVYLDGSYQRIYYCNGKGTFGADIHDAGWFLESHWGGNLIGNHSGTNYQPMTSASDTTANHLQFYTKVGGGSITKREALINAVNSFIDALANDAYGQTSAHAITVVRYPGDGSYDAKSILSRTEVTATNKESIKSSISSGLEASGATPADSGMSKALEVINATDNDRQKYVIMFTDGEPNHGNDFSSKYAVKTIQNAYSLKNNATEKNKAIVYTVGIFDTDADTNVYPYMHLVSSNYNLTSTDASDDGFEALAEQVTSTSPSGYFLTADTSSELNAVFTSISSEISKASIELHEDTQLRDVISEFYKLDINADMGRGIQVYSSKCTSVVKQSDGSYSYTWNDETANMLTFYATGTQDLTTGDGSVIKLTLTATESASDGENNDIWVTGFDFSENWVGLDGDGNARGRKLTMIIPLTQKEMGEDYEQFPETNTGDSGIYDKDGNQLNKYGKPSVQVPVMLRFNLQTKNVSSTEFPQFAFTAGNGAESVVFDTDGWGTDDWTDKLTLSDETIKKELPFTLLNLGNDKTSDKSIYANHGDTVVLKSTTVIPEDCVVYINDKPIALTADRKVEFNVTENVTGVTLKTVNIRIEKNATLSVKCEINGGTDQDTKTFNYKVTVVDQGGDTNILTKSLKNGETWDLGSQPGNAVVTVEQLDSDGYTVLIQQDGETVTKASTYTFTLTGDTAITAQSYTGVAFPATGGSGTTVYIICGSALMLSAVIGGFVLTYRKRKEGIWG